MWHLSASRWDKSLTTKLENLPAIADLGIRWALPGGVQRLELMIKASSRAEAIARHERHLGHWIVINDNFIDRPIVSGQIYEVSLDGLFVYYICGSHWKRHYDQFYTVGDMSDLTLPTDDTDVLLKDILDDTVTVLGSDQTNIAATSLNSGSWTPDGTIGTKAGDAISQIASIGDSSNNYLDYYIKERPFLAGKPQAALPVLAARSTTAAPNWIISESDLAGGGLQQSRHVWEFKSSVRIGYGILSGKHTNVATSATILTDSTASFIASGVTVGDIVTNLSDGSAGEVSAVTSATSLTVHVLAGGSGNNFVQNDVYGIRLNEPKWTSAATSTSVEYTNDFWTVEYAEVQADMDATQAAKYATTLLNLFDKPVLQQAVTITAPTIRDKNGARWPLWRVVANGGGYVKISGIKPRVTKSSTRSKNSLDAFKISAMDYTYRDNTLRLVPDLPDSRLDSILQQAGLIAGQLISTAPPLPPPGVAFSDTGVRLTGARLVRSVGLSSLSTAPAIIGGPAPPQIANGHHGHG